MKLTPRAVRPALLAPLALAAALSLEGCAGTRLHSEPWVYGISRNFYPTCGGELFVNMAQDVHSECAALTAVCIFVLPLAVDTVLLPVTVPHDLLVKR